MANGIDLLIEDKVAEVVLNAPDRRNAFSSTMLTAFEDALETIERNRNVEVAVLRAEGPVFCSGSDLKELETFTADDTLHWQNRTARVVERWVRLEATTVTAYHGPAIGSGAIIGLGSDLRIAADTAKFSFPEVAYGIPLTWSGIPILTMLLGPDRTKRMLMLSETLDANQLLHHDVVMDVHPANELGSATNSLVERVLKAPQIGRLMTKRAVLAAAASPGFSTTAYEPFLASLSIHRRGANGFEFGNKPE